ncbi:MAG: polysaccharide biosynthesis tyrosine autokinase [Phycisphaeraceae bacterium]|nr:MAG: polysaccharide biosynthesis tyrosine autokinase [Phycisphaeraceae bacterium]
MSTAAAPINPATPAPRPAVAPPPPPPAGATLDPIKLILRNKWLLIGSLVVGLVLGTAGHFVWMKLYPFYKPRAMFVCNPTEVDPYRPTGAGVVSQDEMQTFMQTQVRLMTSEEVLRAVAQNPNLPTLAKKWSAGFRKSDGSINTSEVLQELKDEVRARTVPQTSLIELSFTWKDPLDAAEIVNMVMNEYMGQVRRRNDDAFKDRTNVLSQQIEEARREVDRLKTRRSALQREKNVDTNDPKLGQAVRELDIYTRSLSDVEQFLQEVTTRIKAREEELYDKSGSVVYNDEIRALVAREPQVLSIRESITGLEAELAAMDRRGITREHRQYKVFETRLEGYRQQLAAVENEALGREFNRQYSDLQLRKRALDAQQSEMQGKIDALKLRQTEINQTLSELGDIDDKIRQLEFSRNSAQDDLGKLNAIILLPTAKRIQTLQTSVSKPDEPEFPKLIFMIPAGAVVCLALVTGFVVLREVVDTRIKGPADVGLLPRTRLVGWVADAEEDPSGPGAVETAFRDRPRGVLAENFRQVRAGVLKRMETAGHKALVVVGCIPSSGSTSVVSNLALATAAAGRSVLVIDANLRRPGQHRVFGVAEGPGLGDVLAGAATLDDAAVAVEGTPRLRVLPAGTREHRAYEALSSDAFSTLLRDARAKYDVILIDTPPAVVSGDAVAIANRADASFLVARAFSEKRGMIARFRTELSEARGEFIGVLVNGVKSAAGGYLKGNIRTAHEYHSDQA